jgi:preprotein translocase subunit SecA
MNSQREVVYTKRRHALYGERLSVDVANTIYDVCESLVVEFQENRDYQGFKLELIKVFAVEANIEEQDFFALKSDEITEKIYEDVAVAYKNKCDYLAAKVYPVVKDLHDSSSFRYENISIPITDGMKTMNLLANIQSILNTKGKEVTVAVEKGLTLAIIDDEWKEHLREMDDLKQSVQNATYEQKDPLLIYKFESFQLFKDMVQKINKDIVSFLFKGNLPIEDNVQDSRGPEKTDMSKLKTGRTDLPPANNRTSEEQKPQPVKVEKKVGRNDPCPCGSGKKYKNCHGAE